LQIVKKLPKSSIRHTGEANHAPSTMPNPMDLVSSGTHDRDVETLELDQEPDKLDTEHRYTQQAIEKIIGRAAQAQAERDGTAQRVKGVRRETALATAVELADTLQLDRALVKQAFEQYESDKVSHQQWVAHLGAQPHPHAIAKSLAHDMTVAGRDLGLSSIFTNISNSTYVIDQNKHQDAALTHEVLRIAQMYSGFLSNRRLNRAGTLPATRLLVRRRRRVRTWILGFIPWSRIVLEKLATFKLVGLEEGVILNGTLHHDQMPTLLGPILQRMQAIPGQPVQLGHIDYDFPLRKK
jgi:hypothetical protein